MSVTNTSEIKKRLRAEAAERDLASLRRQIGDAEMRDAEKVARKARKKRDLETLECSRAQQGRRRTRHVVRFKDPRLNAIRKAIRKASPEVPLSDVLSSMEISRVQLDAALDAIRHAFEMDVELLRRVGYAWTCWEGLALVHLPETQTKGVRTKKAKAA